MTLALCHFVPRSVVFRMSLCLYLLSLLLVLVGLTLSQSTNFSNRWVTLELTVSTNKIPIVAYLNVKQMRLDANWKELVSNKAHGDAKSLSLCPTPAEKTAERNSFLEWLQSTGNTDAVGAAVQRIEDECRNMQHWGRLTLGVYSTGFVLGVLLFLASMYVMPIIQKNRTMGLTFVAQFLLPLSATVTATALYRQDVTRYGRQLLLSISPSLYQESMNSVKLQLGPVFNLMIAATTLQCFAFLLAIVRFVIYVGKNAHVKEQQIEAQRRLECGDPMKPPEEWFQIVVGPSSLSGSILDTSTSQESSSTKKERRGRKIRKMFNEFVMRHRWVNDDVRRQEHVWDEQKEFAVMSLRAKCIALTEEMLHQVEQSSPCFQSPRDRLRGEKQSQKNSTGGQKNSRRSAPSIIHRHEGTLAPTGREETYGELIPYFERVNPPKVNDIDDILDRYMGRWDELYIALEKKYGIPVNGTLSSRTTGNGSYPNSQQAVNSNIISSSNGNDYYYHPHKNKSNIAALPETKHEAPPRPGTPPATRGHGQPTVLQEYKSQRGSGSSQAPPTENPIELYERIQNRNSVLDPELSHTISDSAYTRVNTNGGDSHKSQGKSANDQVHGDKNHLPEKNSVIAAEAKQDGPLKLTNGQGTNESGTDDADSKPVPPLQPGDLAVHVDESTSNSHSNCSNPEEIQKLKRFQPEQEHSNGQLPETEHTAVEKEGKVEQDDVTEKENTKLENVSLSNDINKIDDENNALQGHKSIISVDMVSPMTETEEAVAIYLKGVPIQDSDVQAN